MSTATVSGLAIDGWRKIMKRKLYIILLLFLFVPSLVSAKIVFRSRRDVIGFGSIFVMDDDGSNIQRLTHPPNHNSGPAWSPDGKHIVFSKSIRVEDPKQGQRKSLFIIDQDGSNERRLTHAPTLDSQAEWSPDGQHIVFCSHRSGKPEIHVININTGGIQQLTHSPDKAWAAGPSWSPNGKYITYRYRLPENGNSTIYVMNADGKNATPLIKVDKWTRFTPSWSPDSKSVLYFEATYKGFQLDTNNVVIQEHKSPNRRRILNIPRNWFVHAVAWADGGRQVLICAEEWQVDDSPIDIYKYHLETNKIINLTNHPMEDLSPHWISDDVFPVTPLDKKKTQWGNVKENKP